jgi:predicted RecB family nuclease
MEAYPDARIVTCSGSRFEERITRTRLAAHDLPTAICDVVEDIHPRLRRSVALPTGSYRVKEVGAFFGYQYKHPEWDGFAVASLYEMQYRKLRDLGKRRKLAKKLIEYNEDDVRCLPFILNALERLASENSGR